MFKAAFGAAAVVAVVVVSATLFMNYRNQPLGRRSGSDARPESEPWSTHADTDPRAVTAARQPEPRPDLDRDRPPECRACRLAGRSIRPGRRRLRRGQHIERRRELAAPQPGDPYPGNHEAQGGFASWEDDVVGWWNARESRAGHRRSDPAALPSRRPCGPSAAGGARGRRRPSMVRSGRSASGPWAWWPRPLQARLGRLGRHEAGRGLGLALHGGGLRERDPRYRDGQRPRPPCRVGRRGLRARRFPGLGLRVVQPRWRAVDGHPRVPRGDGRHRGRVGRLHRSRERWDVALGGRHDLAQPRRGGGSLGRIPAAVDGRRARHRWDPAASTSGPPKGHSALPMAAELPAATEDSFAGLAAGRSGSSQSINRSTKSSSPETAWTGRSSPCPAEMIADESRRRCQTVAVGDRSVLVLWVESGDQQVPVPSLWLGTPNVAPTASNRHNSAPILVAGVEGSTNEPHAQDRPGDRGHRRHRGGRGCLLTVESVRQRGGWRAVSLAACAHP